MNRFFGCALVTVSVTISCIILLLSGCSVPNHEGFAVYLTREDIPPSQMPILSHIDIVEQPVLSMEDIIAYNAQTHEIKLTADAFARITKLDVPVRGRSFVVCVDRQPLYAGAFWTPISSISYNGVTIWKPLIPREPQIIKLELGYPSSSFYGGEDPRANPEIFKSLEQAGKLMTPLTIETVEKLPHSLKGYELYSWLQDEQWNFTLITGTNRNKTLDEIISPTNIVSEDEWVQIQVVGVDAIKTVLSRLPEKEYVFWLAGLRTEQTPQDSIDVTLPEAPTIDVIKEHAGQCGLDLLVQAP